MSLSFLLKTFEAEDDPKKKKDEPDLAGILQRARLRRGRAKEVYPSSEYFNPSLITFGYCKRAKVAQLAGLTDLFRKPPTPKEELRMDVGKKIHDIIQGYFWKSGLLEGEFRCYKCNKSWWDISPQECPYVKSHGREPLKFKEVPLHDDEYQIRARADGLVHLDWKGNKEVHLMDIKSIKNRGLQGSDREFCFEDLDRLGPKPAHVIQLNFYMWMSDYHKGHLLYMGINTCQMKSYYLEYDRSIIQPYLDDITDTIFKAQQVRNGQAKLPEPCDKEKCTCHEIVQYGVVHERAEETS